MNQTQTTALPKLFIGMDVHKKSWTIHFKTDLFDNKTITIPTDPLVLVSYVEKHFEGHQRVSRRGLGEHRAIATFLLYIASWLLSNKYPQQMELTLSQSPALTGCLFLKSATPMIVYISGLMF